MTNVNKVKSSEVLTEQIAKLEFYESELHDILENKTKHPTKYVDKTRKLLVDIKSTLVISYMELGAKMLRDELIGEVTHSFTKEQKEKLL